MSAAATTAPIDAPTARAARPGAWDLVFVAVLAAGVAVRVVTIEAYKPVFVLLQDSITYLRQALGGDLASTWHPALYALFLRPLLATHDLLVVAIAQHALGVATGIALYALLRFRLGLHPAAAALGSAPVLLDGYQIDLEHHVLAEAPFEALAVAGLISIVWPRRAGWAPYALGGALLGLAALTRYAGLALIPAGLLYVVLRQRRWLPALALALGAVVPLAAYAGWHGSTSGSAAITQRNGFFLYGRVASFARCRGLHLPPAERKLCIHQPPSQRVIVGVWGPHSPIAALHGEGSVAHRNHLALDFSLRVIRHQPLDYLHAVGSDLATFFSPAPLLDKEPTAATRWTFPVRFSDVVLGGREVEALHGSAPPDLGVSQRFRIERGPARFLHSYQAAVHVGGPLLGAFVALGLLGTLLPGPSERRHAGLLFALGSLGLMLFSVATTVYHTRYTIPPVALAGPAGALGLVAALRALWVWLELPGSARIASADSAG